MTVYRFGPFLLDAARRELSRDGRAIGLTPKAFDLMVYLIEHRQRAVGRDELISGVWGRVDVSDNVLDQIVLRARKALADLDSERQYIATRPRFGFAWVAPVTVETADDSPAAATRPIVQNMDPDTHRSTRHLPLRWLSLIGLLIISLWVGHGTVQAPAFSSAPIAAPTTDSSTLVLPMEISAAEQVDWARLGLMDAVAHRLRAAGLDTLPSDNALAFLRGHAEGADDPDLSARARQIGVTQLVRGSATQSATGWRVALQMQRADRRPLDVVVEVGQALEAARLAADQLALALQLTPSDPAPIDDAGLGLRLQQIDAAVLGDALDIAEQWLDQLSAEQRNDPRVQLRAATLTFRRGQLDAAQGQFDRLLASVSAADDPHLRANVLNASGNLALRRGDPAEAERRAEQAVALLGALPPSSELGRALTGRAIARSTQAQFDRAVSDFAQARVVLEAVGDRLAAARVEVNLGILEARRDRYAEAEPLLAQASERLAGFNDLTNELYAQVTLAQVRLGLLRPAAALLAADRLAELCEREPNRERRRYANLTRVQVLAANGRLRAAAALLDEVRNEANAEGDIVLLGVAQSITAAWALADDPQRAAREAQASLNSPWQDEGPRQFAATWRVLLRSRIDSADPVAAEATQQGFEAWASSTASPAILVNLSLARAEWAAARGDQQAAEQAFVQAISAAEASRLPAELLEVVESYANWLLGQNRISEAVAVIGRSSGFAEREFRAALLAARLYQALGQTEAWQRSLAQARSLAGERTLPSHHAAATH